MSGKVLNIMIKPASSLCNMRCGYCFYADEVSRREVKSYGIMSEETRDALLAWVAAATGEGDRVTFAFQGGEPTMAGSAYFHGFAEKARECLHGVQVFYALQTNALVLEEEMLRFLQENRVLTGVSYDLLPDCHDEARKDAGGLGTAERVLRNMGRLQEHHVEYNVLCTLTREVARHPREVWKELVEKDIRYVQFTPCLDELDRPGASRYALTPDLFASFYLGIFGEWFRAYQQQQYRSIKLLDDLVNEIAWGRIGGCGLNGHCQPQLIIEADGSIYPCDFYCLDADRIGMVRDTPLMQALQASAYAPFKTKAAPQRCRQCRYAKICGGGCQRMRREICFAQETDACGMQRLLDAAMPAFTFIAQRERHYGMPG